jgi:endoglycosylceramidase
MCERRGIYVLLEFHQDLFSERYCGNGAPLWASKPLKMNSKFGFPWPMKKPFKIMNGSFIADPLECESLNLAAGFYTFQVASAFEDLYQNWNGVLDSFGNYWKKIVSEFKNKRNILGYEIFNGSFYTPSPHERRTVCWSILQKSCPAFVFSFGSNTASTILRSNFSEHSRR